MWNPLEEKHLTYLPEKISKKIESESKIETTLTLSKIKLNLPNLLQNFKSLSWNNIIIFTLHLSDTKNKSHVFIQCYYSMCLIPKIKKKKLSLVIWSIVFSQNLQRKGICSLILNILENKCVKDDTYLVVMAITSNSMQNLCLKRKYKNRGAFSMYFDIKEIDLKLIDHNNNLDVFIPIHKPIKMVEGLDSISEFCSSLNFFSKNVHILKELKMNNQNQVDPWRKSCLSFKIEFEKLFKLTNNGTLSTSWKRLQEVRKFCLKYDSLMRVSSKVIIVVPTFEKPGFQEIDKSNRNKNKLLQIHSASFITYVTICQAFRVKMQKGFNILTSLDDIEYIDDD